VRVDAMMNWGYGMTGGFMKRIISAVAAITLVAAAASARATENLTLDGTWSWNSGSNGDLEAIFTSTGDATWDVAFHFEFRGKARVYNGTAKGYLGTGALEGEVESASGRRHWTFAGTFTDGRLRGTHSEIVDGEADLTGTLTLRQPD